jgi:hypothetical protein
VFFFQFFFLLKFAERDRRAKWREAEEGGKKWSPEHTKILPGKFSHASLESTW